jgi:hypothetical protein
VKFALFEKCQKAKPGDPEDIKAQAKKNAAKLFYKYRIEVEGEELDPIVRLVD